MSKLLVTLLVLLGLADLSPAYGPHDPGLAATGGAQVPGNGPATVEARIEQDLEDAIARVQPLLDRYGYPAVFLTIMAEGVGLIAPGQTLLIAAAVTAAHGHLNIVWVLTCALLAAVLGNSLGYILGRWGGRPLLARLRVRGERLARLEGYFGRYGRGVILIARFVDGLRQLNGMVAGMLNMGWGVFTAFNVLGAIFWTGAWGLVAYFLDREITVYHGAFRRLAPWMAALSIIGVLVLMAYLLRHRRTGPSA